MNNIIIDIETSALPIEHLKKIMPKFEASKVLKDPDKIKSDIEAKQKKWMDDAALSAETGSVLVIGIMNENDNAEYFEGSESELISLFWKSWSALNPATWIGHYILGFDFPFIIRRSFALGIKVPSELTRGRYLPDIIQDTMARWACGTRDTISLDNLSKTLGVGSKNGSGKDFSALYLSDRESALEYLENDLKLAKACAEKMGMI